MKEATHWFRQGLAAGIPICLGYFAVSFALGIAAKEAGLGALAATLMSLTCVSSTGQYAALTLIAAGASAVEMAATQAVVNIRYLLMSTALTQKLGSESPLWQRLLLGFCVTDELFGISTAFEGSLRPAYTYGAALVSVMGWCAGTCAGVLVGNVLPARLASALGIALFGMFIAILVPPARENRVIAGLVLAAMAFSWLSGILPGVREISEGFRIILLTVSVSAAGALLFPIREAQHE